MSDDYTIKPHPTDTVSFHNNGKVFLTIKPDGTVIIPDDVLTDEAARTFWQVIEGYGPKKEITRLRDELAAANKRAANRLEVEAERDAANKRYQAAQLTSHTIGEYLKTAEAERDTLRADLAASRAEFEQLSGAFEDARAELAAERERAKEAYDQGRASRSAVVAAGHALFVYAQKVTHKIKHHSLEKLLPSPDDELLAFIRAVDDSSKSERARIDAVLGGGDD